MYKRLVDEALRDGVLAERDLASFTDEGLLHRLESGSPSPLLHALRTRRLYKRALECSAAELPEGVWEWIADDRARTIAAEDALASELGLAPGELILDFPAKPQMLGLDLPVLRRDGSIRRLTSTGWAGAIDLPALSRELYRAARWLRVFVARPVAVTQAVLEPFLAR